MSHSRWSSSESDGDDGGCENSITLTQVSVKRSSSAARAKLLLKRMTDSVGVDAAWVGVGEIEKLRALTPAQTRLQALIDKLVESERRFIVNIDVIRIIDTPSIKRRLTPSVDVVGILHRIFKQHILLLHGHKRFLRELLETRPCLQSGGALALVLIKHAPQFVDVYTSFAQSLPSAFDRISEEANESPEFRHALAVLYPYIL